MFQIEKNLILDQQAPNLYINQEGIHTLKNLISKLAFNTSSIITLASAKIIQYQQ